MYWATQRRHSFLSVDSISASSQLIPIVLRSLVTISLQFFLGLPGLRLKPSSCQFIPCRGIRSLPILITCPSHLSLLSVMMVSIFRSPVRRLTSSFFTLSFQVIPNSFLCHLWCAASSFFMAVTVMGHNSALYNNMDSMSVSYSLTLTVWLTVLLFHIFNSLSKHAAALPVVTLMSFFATAIVWDVATQVAKVFYYFDMCASSLYVRIIHPTFAYHHFTFPSV